ncbi:MAG TPA: PilZ domain-containing protein, partial [Myxococcota bacterium]|nr:PilZ domain-containing protein [Myxococcota bacterium]
MPPEAPPSSAPGAIYQVLVELPTGEVRLESVLALGGGLAEVAYRGPTGSLRPGTLLANVQLFADGLRVLTCPASVQDLQGEGQEALLTLALQTTREEADAPVQRDDLVTKTVQSLLEARASASLTIDGATLPGQAFLARAEADPRRLVIEMQLPEGSVLPAPGRVCEVTCLLVGARVVLLAKVHSHKTGRRATSELHLRWPHTLRASKKRVGRRVRKLETPLRMQARLPFAAQADTYPVADVSMNGLAFEASADTWLAVGMVIPSLDLRLPQGTVRARGVVRNVRPVGGRLSVGLALQDLAPAHARTLSDFVDAQVYPHARPATPRDLSQLWDLYRQRGLPLHPLAPKAVSRFESLRSLLLGRGGALLTQIVLGDQALQATAELVRVGEKALRLQHVAAQTDPPTPLGAALPPLIGAALKRSDWAFVQVLLAMPGGGAFDPAPFEAAAGSKHVGWRVWAVG